MMMSSSSSLSYRWWGPTCRQLHLEGALWLSLIFLTLATLQTQQQQQQSRSLFGWTGGDYIYLLGTMVWLSRYLVLRYWAYAPRSGKGPTLWGLIASFVGSHVLGGGQIWDIPPHTIARHSIVGSSGSSQQYSVATPTLPNAVRYLIHWLTLRLWFPLCRGLEAFGVGSTLWRWHYAIRHTSWDLGGGDSISRRWIFANRLGSFFLGGGMGSGGGSMTPGSGGNTSVTRGKSYITRLRYTLQRWGQSLSSFVVAYIPSMGFQLVVLVAAFYIFELHHLYSGTITSPVDSLATTTWFVSTYRRLLGLPEPVTRHFMLSENEKATWVPYGAYRNITRPEWSQVFFYMTLFPTLVSLFYYCRIALPIPDQVAGGNVVQDVRTEVRNSGMASSGGGRSKGGGGSGRGSAPQRESQDMPWSERVRPITTQNRFRLAFDVRLIRVLESVFLCGIFPRTAYVCRAVGRCPEGVQVWELNRLLFPTGISTPLRRDGALSITFGVSDVISVMWSLLGIAFVSLILQTAQTVVLNKTYLAVLAYITNEWDPVTDHPPEASLPPVWDPRRRYKKGDLVLFPPYRRRQTVYRATTNSPESKPPGFRARFEQNLFKQELGHSSTSPLLYRLSLVQTVLVAVHVLVFLTCGLFGLATNGMPSTIIAHIISAYAVIMAGMPNHDELAHLNDEIVQGTLQ